MLEKKNATDKLEKNGERPLLLNTKKTGHIDLFDILFRKKEKITIKYCKCNNVGTEKKRSFVPTLLRSNIFAFTVMEK